MSFRSTLLAAAAFLATADAHIKLAKPVPFSADKVTLDPITADQFPCKSNLGFTVTTMNQMKVGESQQVSFDGTAVHGGGSCQLSYTQDSVPTKSSSFKVIKSIEGGCPGVDGATKSFDFELPDSIPNGKGTFAWTWFAKLSGGPEMYMNCAPIEVSGGASDASGLDALPDMFVANIASTTCKSPANKAVQFPNAGVDPLSGGTNDLEAPTGECGASGSTPPAASSGGAQPSSVPSSAPASGPSAPASAPSSAPASAPASGPSAAPSLGGGSEASLPAAEPSAAPSNPGGVFAPGASSGAAAPTTLATVTSAAPSAPIGTGSPSSPTGTPSSGGSTCSGNGAIVCNGTDQFGLCNNGEVVWQAVAAGTTCSNGSIQKRGYNGRIARPRYVVTDKDFTPGN